MTYTFSEYVISQPYMYNADIIEVHFEENPRTSHCEKVDYFLSKYPDREVLSVRGYVFKLGGAK